MRVAVPPEKVPRDRLVAAVGRIIRITPLALVARVALAAERREVGELRVVRHEVLPVVAVDAL